MYDKRLSKYNNRLLNGIFNCNSFEYKCKSMSDAKCEYCECEKEDIKYLIFDCFTVQRLWKNWIVLRISVHTGNTSI